MTATPPNFKVYPDNRGEWRWRFVASNGLTLADSGEGYKSLGDLLKAIRLLKVSAKASRVKPFGKRQQELFHIGRPRRSPTLC